MESIESTYLPLAVDERAYLFFPNQKQQKTQFTKKGARFFFFGQVEHDQYEKKKIGEFHEYVLKHKLHYNKQFFDQHRLLLFLQGNAYKPKETIEAMDHHLTFRKEYLPVDFNKVQKLVKSGFMYPCGRDKNFRPILVFNATLVDFKDVEIGIHATCLVHEQIIKNMFLPGQVENWVVIYDLGGMGLTEIPISAIKHTTGKMSANYGGRLYKMFTVNAPGSIWFAWKAVSAFLDPVTVDKIKISKTNTEKSMFDIADSSQVEIKYGGTQPNRKQYWPFRIPEGVFDEKRLIKIDEYEKKLKGGYLTRNIIHPQYLQKKQSKEVPKELIVEKEVKEQENQDVEKVQEVKKLAQ